LPADKPNVVLIMVDQMRHDAAGFAGSAVAQTPALDRLAAEGACFDNAYCASPVCSPARASWLTGLYPHRHGLLGNYGPKRRGIPGYELPQHTPTLGDAFAKAGYRCGMIGPWHMGNDERPQHGFDALWSPYRYVSPPDDHYLRYLGGLGLLDRYHADRAVRTKFETAAQALYATPQVREAFGADGLRRPAECEGIPLHEQPRIMSSYMELPVGVTSLPPEHQRTSWTVTRGIEFVRTTPGPFFLFLSIKDPHPPIAPPAEFLSRYRLDDIAAPLNWEGRLDGKPAFQRASLNRRTEAYGREGFRIYARHYLAQVSHVDAQMRQCVRDKLRPDREGAYGWCLEEETCSRKPTATVS
jgi:hypothetical protein